MVDSSEPFVRGLSDLCRRIAAGHYDDLDDLFAISGREDAPEDIRALAEAFSFMAIQVEAREFRLTNTIEELEEVSRQLRVAKDQLSNENSSLKLEVDRLRIEIDHSRKEEEVAEITETDYFHELQSRARQLRQRRATGPTDP